jgi:hypothetical protein
VLSHWETCNVTNLDDLENLANAAPQTKFIADTSGEGFYLKWVNPFSGDLETVIAYYWPGHPVEETKKVEHWYEALAKLHAAVHPAAVLELIARVRDAERDCEDRNYWKNEAIAYKEAAIALRESMAVLRQERERNCNADQLSATRLRAALEQIAKKRRHCPNPYCHGPGAAFFRSKLKSYKEDGNGNTHTVDEQEYRDAAKRYLCLPPRWLLAARVRLTANKKKQPTPWNGDSK